MHKSSVSVAFVFAMAAAISYVSMNWSHVGAYKAAYAAVPADGACGENTAANHDVGVMVSVLAALTLILNLGAAVLLINSAVHIKDHYGDRFTVPVLAAALIFALCTFAFNLSAVALNVQRDSKIPACKTDLESHDGDIGALRAAILLDARDMEDEQRIVNFIALLFSIFCILIYFIITSSA